MNRTMRVGAVLTASTLAFTGLTMGTADAGHEDTRLKVCVYGYDDATDDIDIDVDVEDEFSANFPDEGNCFEDDVDSGRTDIDVEITGPDAVEFELDKAKIRDRRGSRTVNLSGDSDDFTVRIKSGKTNRVNIFLDED